MSDLEGEQLYQAGVRAASNGDFAKAVGLWETAAGMEHAKAQYNLGVALARGKGTEADLARARRLWERAAEAGHREAAKQLAALPIEKPQAAPTTTTLSILARCWSMYLGIGMLFASAKLLSLAAWVITGLSRASTRPDLPWYARLVQEGGTIAFAVAGAALSVVMWPYSLYVFWAEGRAAFFRSMFYLWFL